MSTTDFFPPPDVPFDEPGLVEVQGAAVISMGTADNDPDVVVVAAVQAEGKLVSMRFRQKRHHRIVRTFFKACGIKKVPLRAFLAEVEAGGGAYFVNIEGHAVGEDKLPEEANIGQALVLHQVRMRPLFA